MEMPQGETPQNETPSVLTSLNATVTDFLSTYGWHIVFFVVVVNLIWSHFKPKWTKWRQRQQDMQREAEYHRDPERLITMEEQMRISRLRLQEEHDRLAKEKAEKMKKMEEEKREEKIKKWQAIQTGRSVQGLQNMSEESPSLEHRSKPKPKTERLRGQDFNPLMGSGSGSTFRPSRRSGTSGG